MREIALLGRRAIRETLRQPESTIPPLFIPVFFLLVNAGQLGKQFAGQPWLFGQKYVSFQLPISVLFSVTAFGAGLALVTEIENGYFDKLRAAPIRRTSILFGRMAADFGRSIVTSAFVLVIGLILGVRIASGPLGALLILVLTASFGIAYGGFATLIALKTRQAQAVNVTSLIFFPLLFVAPNVLPRDHMQHWMEIASAWNPVTYIIEGIRGLTLEGWPAHKILMAVLVIVVTFTILTAFSVRAINRFE